MLPLAAAAVLAMAAPANGQVFPAEFDLTALESEQGGNGTLGYVTNGAEPLSATSLVRGAGDINGDGIGDLVIGTGPVDDDAAPGVAYVLFGAPGMRGAEVDLADLEAANGGDGSAGFVIRGIAAGDQAGVSVDGRADVNGDGIDDIVLGAPGADPAGRVDSGQAYVIFGRADAFPPEIELADLLTANGGDGSTGVVLNGILPTAATGSAVAFAGDINDDGIDDVLIGAPGGDPGGRIDAGVSFVVFGRPGGFAAEFDLRDLLVGGGEDGFVLVGIDAGDRSGAAVSRAGDVNGDGIGDLLLGAPGASRGTGEAYLVYGRDAGFANELDLVELLIANGGNGSAGVVLAGIAGSETGTAVSAADLNGDGLRDAIIGGPRATIDAVIQDGAAFVVFGRSGLPAEFPLTNLLEAGGGDGSQGTVLVGQRDSSWAGVSVAGMGDINGDGIEDIGVGALDGFQTELFEASYVVFGRNAAFPAEFRLAGLLPFSGGDGSEGFVAAFGHAWQVAGLGDINGDDVDDMAFGAPDGDDPGGGDVVGEGFVVFGRLTGTEAQLAVTVVGADLRVVQCQNLTDPQALVVPSPGVAVRADANCVEAGLDVTPGDTAQTVVLTQALTPVLRGRTIGFGPGGTATCVNTSTGQPVPLSLAPSGAWDCAAAGLPFTAGDAVAVLFAGDLIAAAPGAGQTRQRPAGDD